jgi:hypothetical protein
MRRRPWPALVLAVAAASIAILIACSQPSKGALILAISTDMQTPKDIQLISVYVATDSVPKFDYVGRVAPDGTVSLPSTLAIVEPDKLGAQVRIRVIAFQNDKAMILRDVLTTVPHQRTALLRLPLNFLDYGTATGSIPTQYVPDGVNVPDGDTTWDPTNDPTNPDPVTSPCDFTQNQTMFDGVCASALVDSGLLPDYKDSDVFGDGGAAGSCFDVGQCFASSIPVTNLDTGGCTFPLPAGAAAGTFNVALVTESGAGLCLDGVHCYIPLENDPDGCGTSTSLPCEGWALGQGGGGEAGQTVQLVPGVCAKVKSGAQLSVSTGACAPKVESDPVCEPGTADAGAVDASAEVATDGGLPQTCAAAAAASWYVGCDFWPTVTENIVQSVFDYAVVVANVTGAQTANVTVTGPGGVNQSLSVAPGQLAKIYLPWVPALKGPDSTCGASSALTSSVLATGSAYHLVSNVPVAVYQFNALEYAGVGGPAGKDWSSCTDNDAGCDPDGCFSFTNDASLLLPTAAMTGNYRVTGHEGWGTGTMGAFVAITATADGTTVNLKVSSTGQVLAGTGIAATAAGGTLTLTMNAGDVAELVGQATVGSDLSGSLIQASKPVQVITGLPCTDVPDNAQACDHIEESNFPAETLGKDYIVTQPTAPLGGAVGQVIRIYGNFDGTTLTYEPSTPPGCPATINAGDVVECGVVSEDFEVKGSQSFAVSLFTQGGSIVDPSDGAASQGDPDQSMVPAVVQYRNAYVFLAPQDYEENYMVVTAPTGATITLDGAPLNVTGTPIGSSGYDVLRVQLQAGQGGAHVLTASAPVGVQVMGYGEYTSYQYPAGLGLAQISPPPAP